MIRFALAAAIGLAAGYYWGYDHGRRGVETAIHRAMQFADPYAVQQVRRQRAEEMRSRIHEASGAGEVVP